MLSVKGRNRYYQCISISQAFSTLVAPVLACDGKVDRFGQSDQASLYSRYRPQYSSKIIDSIASKVQNWDVYIDWACGSGQLTHKLAPKFNNTFGVDKSLQQLKYLDPNIQNIVNSDFNLKDSFQDGKVDLITVAQAIHWLTPHDIFFNEVNRLLRPDGGAFVIVGYTRPFLANQRMNDIWEEFYFNQLGSLKKPGEAGCWWDVERTIVDSKYITFPFPFKVETLDFTECLSYSVDDFMNYVQTLSAYQTFMLAHPGKEHLYKALRREFVQSLKQQGIDPEVKLDVKFPYFTITRIQE